MRFVPRFVTDPEIPAYFRRADVVALPYREIEQSGVLYTALAFGKPIVLTAVGGFAEVGAQRGAAARPARGRRGARRARCAELLADPGAARSARRRGAGAAAGAYSWDAIARADLALYRGLAGG